MIFVYYWIFPFVAALVWLAMLLAMLADWEAAGAPIYPSFDDGQHIAYISDIGAQRLKPLFIAGSVITTVLLEIAFLSERWLRHTGRLARNTATMEKVLVTLSILFAFVGTCGLILLSIFDTLNYPQKHRIFLVLFMGGYVISAICLCYEYQRLGIKYRQHRVLRLSFWFKLVFVVFEIVLAIIFGVFLYKGITNAGAVLEWVIALVFTFWILSFLIDLLPAVHSKQAETQIESGVEDSTAAQTGHYTTGEPAERGPRGHYDSNGAHGESIPMKQTIAPNF
ncbi:MAG: hypothetical protein M1829_006916 [Trizodia sp. TS-e1964]|nr:MAG: hypothetical protein M1829_006916 [Trizodia sp. TS-e1964]